jgi:hypothetical protein
MGLAVRAVMRVASLRMLALAIVVAPLAIACGGTTLPATTDAGSDAPSDGGCGPGSHLEYDTPGCGVDASPKCVVDGAAEDACAGQFCGCDGVSFFGFCGSADRPFASRGECPSSGDAGPFACGALTCGAGQICQRLQIEGGVVILPDDAGACPPDTENVGGRCQRLPQFSCVPTPSACGATIDCACAGDLCSLLSSCPYVCQGTSGREVQCVCAVP